MCDCWRCKQADKEIAKVDAERASAASDGYDLKPCPFCGCRNITITDRGEGRLQLSCNGCPTFVGQAWGHDETKEDLAVYWNKRS